MLLAAAAREFLGDGALEKAWADDLEERSDGLWSRFDPDVMVAAINEVSVPRWEEWDAIHAPTLVVYGEHGMFTSDEKSEFVLRGHNVQRHDPTGASHDAHLDAFDDWVSALKSFLPITPRAR